jgi:hypothetical protein
MVRLLVADQTQNLERQAYGGLGETEFWEGPSWKGRPTWVP